MPNITNITPPRVPLTDPATGLITREWYKFFLNLFNLTGGGTSDVSVTDLLNAPFGMTAEAFAEINDLYNTVLSQPRYELGSGAEFNIIGPPTAGSVAYGTGSAIGFTNVGSAGQYLTSTGTSTPTWSTVASNVGSVGYWGTFYDTSATQTAASTAVAYPITLGSADPANNGVTVVSGDRITVAHDGVYNIQYSLQFTNIDTSIHNVSVWIRVNDSGSAGDVADSASVYAVTAKHGGTPGQLIAAINYVLELNAGDYVQIMWQTTDTQVYLETVTTVGQPDSPCAIVTVTSQAQIGLGYAGLTSVTSLTIGTGSKTLTTNLDSANTAFVVGSRIRVASSASPSNFMDGIITAFSGTSMTVNVDTTGGSGTFASWNISIVGDNGATATNLLGGGAGQIPYQSATSVTTFLAPAFDLNVLTYNAATNAPVWTPNTGTGNVVRANSPTIYTPTTDTITLGNVSSAGGAKYLVGTYATIAGVLNYLSVYGSEFSAGGPVLCYGVRPSSSSDASPSAGTFYSTTSVNVARGAYTIRGQTHLWWGAAAQTTAVDAAASPALVAQMTLTSSALNLYTGYTYQINGTNVLSATALGSGVVSSSLTSVGTIATGVWQGTQIGAQYGGTGQTVYTVGDILYASTTTALAKLAAGAANYALVSNGAGTAPSYQQVSLTAGVTGVLPVANGGTNASTASITSFNNITGYTASGATGSTSTNLVFSTSPTLTTPKATTTVGVGNATAAASGCGITFPSTQNLSTDVNTLDDYIEGTFTGTATGMTTSPTVTVTYVKIGGLVTLSTATGLTGTSNATTFTMTGMPSTLYPAATRVVFVRVQDNGGAPVMGIATISNAGVVSFFATLGAGAFTAAGTKTFYAITFSYIA